jgi:hypothetical protein
VSRAGRDGFGLLPALLFMAACEGQSSEESANQALGSGRSAEAVAHFDRALAGVEETDGRYLGLLLGKCSALASTDAPRARDLFLATADSHALKVQDYGWFVSYLVSARAFDPAIDILEAGAKAFPDDPKIKEMGQVVRKASEKTGDTAALARLKSLPYL